MTDPDAPPGQPEESVPRPDAATPAPDPALASDPAPEWLTEPPPPALPGKERVLGLRVAAALIDIAVLTGLFAILGFAVGKPSSPLLLPGGTNLGAGPQFGVTGGGLSLGQVTVPGWWLVLYLVLLLLYYFSLEAMTGQTVGKALTGLRVLSDDGTRPSAGSIAGRTLLRFVDWLPLLYLVGFISVLATGQRRLRIGDIAAGTIVAQPVAVPRWRVALALPLAVLAIIGLSIRVSSGPGTYQANGVSFDYPTGWHHFGLKVTASSGRGNKLWQTVVGADRADLVIVEAFRLNLPVTAGNLRALTPQVQNAVQGLFEQGGGSVQAGPEQITMSGLPGLQFRGTLTVAGTPIESTMAFAFDGTTEYFVNCENTPAHAAASQRACAQVMRTFTVG